MKASTPNGKASKGDIAGCGSLHRLCHRPSGHHPSEVGVEAAFHQAVACPMNKRKYCQEL